MFAKQQCGRQQEFPLASSRVRSTLPVLYSHSTWRQSNPNNLKFFFLFNFFKFYVYLTLNNFLLQPLSCPPAMRLVTGQQGNKTLKFLLRGDSEGVIMLWTVPETTSQELSQHNSPPMLPPTIKTSIEDAWEAMKPSPVGILDQMDSGDRHGIKLTASIYLPQQSRLVVGREDGSIIIVPATQTVMLQLLHGNHQQFDGKIFEFGFRVFTIVIQNIPVHCTV